MPIVDVLIPVYNAEETILDSIRSIQQQTVSDISIVIVDDGSTDNTPKIVAEIVRKDPRIKYVRQARNSGIVDALNLGLSHCKSSYVARHDADDISYPHRVEVQIDYLKKNPDCVAVGAEARHIDAEGTFLNSYARLPPTECADPRSFPARDPHLMHPFLVVQREALTQIGGYRHVFYAEDADLYWRLQEVGRLYNIGEVLGDYRIHSGGVTSKSLNNVRIGALTSQLAAVSAVRRRTNLPDLAFPPIRLASYKAAKTMLEMLHFASVDLSVEERIYLELAIAAKLIDARSYRVFCFDESDCVYVKKSFAKHWGRLNVENSKCLREKMIALGVMMLYQRQYQEAGKLLPFSALAKAVCRVGQYAIGGRLSRLVTKGQP